MDDNNNGLLYRWTTDFVGSPMSFKFFLVVTVLGGFCYSFGWVPQPYSSYLLLIFGVVMPVLLTLCLYNTLMNSNLSFSGFQLLSAFKSKKLNYLLRLVDCMLILVFAGLIFFDILNYFIFRFIQTLLIPCLFVVALRLIYVLNNDNGSDANIDGYE